MPSQMLEYSPLPRRLPVAVRVGVVGGILAIALLALAVLWLYWLTRFAGPDHFTLRHWYGFFRYYEVTERTDHPVSSVGIISWPRLALTIALTVGIVAAAWFSSRPLLRR